MKQRVRPADRRQFILAASSAVIALQGCSFRRPFDGEAVDLKGYNLRPDDDEEILDLGAGEDQASPPDLAKPPADLRPPQDLSRSDLTGGPPDLATRPPDLATPDLATQPPDLAGAPPDLACAGDVRITTAGNLPVGGAMLVQDRTLILLARDARGYMAMAANCTHAGCPVRINSGAGTYDCPCHGSRFALNGSVLQGPAQTPMRHVAMCRDGGALVVDQFNYLPGINVRTT